MQCLWCLKCLAHFALLAFLPCSALSLSAFCFALFLIAHIIVNLVKKEGGGGPFFCCPLFASCISSAFLAPSLRSCVLAFSLLLFLCFRSLFPFCESRTARDKRLSFCRSCILSNLSFFVPAFFPFPFCVAFWRRFLF